VLDLLHQPGPGRIAVGLTPPQGGRTLLSFTAYPMTEVWRSAWPEQRGTGMTKAELVEQVAATLALPKRQAATVVQLFWQSIMDALEAGDHVALRGSLNL
jgi:Bacterial DNA-binding protein